MRRHRKHSHQTFNRDTNDAVLSAETTRAERDDRAEQKNRLAGRQEEDRKRRWANLVE